MGTLQMWLTLWLVSAVFREVNNSILAHKYNYTVLSLSYTNLLSSDSDGLPCDIVWGEASHCDVRIVIEVVCENCWANAPLFYPSKENFYVNSDRLNKSNLDSLAKLHVVFDTSVTNVLIRFTVMDADYLLDDTVYIGSFSFKKHHVYLRTKLAYRNATKSDYLSLEQRLDCAEPACGEYCVVPNDYIACQNDTPVCVNGTFFEECELFAGNFAWSILVLPVDNGHKNNSNNELKSKKACKEVLSVCMDAHKVKDCQRRNVTRPTVLLFSAKLARKSSNFILSLNSTCDGDSVIANASTTKVPVALGRTLRFVYTRFDISIRSGCQPQYTGELCSDFNRL